jgi:penicillin-binding protein 2
LQITIDSRLQEYIHDLFKDQAGAAVVMKTNGELLATVSYPSYDPNMFVTGISQKQWDEIRFDFDHPFTNKFINGMYPPGSVIKMGVGLAMFDAGDINEHTTTYCTSNFKINDYPFRCWKEEGHGKTDFNKAIRESCDDYFYKNSIKTGINKIAQVLRSVGLGEKTGIDLPNESYGTIPDIPWKHRRYNQRWYMGDTVNSSIGQGYMLVTPMQIAKHTAFLATDALPVPRYVNKEESNATVIQSQMAERNPRAMIAIRKAMREVAAHHKGTAHWYTRKSKVDIAAKTGTAQVVSIPQDEKKRMEESELEYYHRSHAWLTTYGPYDDPQVVVSVVVEHGGHGGEAAGPMISKIYNWLLKQGYIKQ